MRLPNKFANILERTQAVCCFDPFSQKITIEHKGMTEKEKKSLSLWYGMHFPYRLEFKEVQE